MLAVFAPIEDVSSLVRAHGLDLVIANKNAPRQCVLSGSAKEIERSRRDLADRGLTARPVPVAAAFHSQMVAEAAIPFRDVVATVNLIAFGDSPSSPTRPPTRTPRIRSRFETSWPASSPGRSSSSRWSRRCIEVEPARSWKLAPTRS